MKKIASLFVIFVLILVALLFISLGCATKAMKEEQSVAPAEAVSDKISDEERAVVKKKGEETESLTKEFATKEVPKTKGLLPGKSEGGKGPS